MSAPRIRAPDGLIVVDATALVDMLCQRPSAARVGAAIAGRGGQIHAPHLIDAEVGHGFRGLVLGGKLTENDARAALGDLLALDVVRYPHAPLLDRAFDFYRNLTIYDALYLALAETLDAPLVTQDAAFRDVPGSTVEVLFIAR